MGRRIWRQIRADAGRSREGCDVVLACVGRDADLREVTLGAHGAFAP